MAPEMSQKRKNAKCQIRLTETFNWHNYVMIHWTLQLDKFNQWGHTKIDTTWEIRRNNGITIQCILMNELVRFVVFFSHRAISRATLFPMSSMFVCVFFFNFMVGYHFKFWWKSPKQTLQNAALFTLITKTKQFSDWKILIHYFWKVFQVKFMGHVFLPLLNYYVWKNGLTSEFIFKSNPSWINFWHTLWVWVMRSFYRWY